MDEILQSLLTSGGEMTAAAVLALIASGRQLPGPMDMNIAPPDLNEFDDLLLDKDAYDDQEAYQHASHFESQVASGDGLETRLIAEPTRDDRELVDLLFFPTGGGKTEAYLGLAAFTLVLRRLKNPGIASAGLSVLMRYTLRLLTLDQLGRAAALICALELERQQDVDKLGLWPFEIGLWVGRAATPHRMGAKGDTDRESARAKTIAFKNDDRKPSPMLPAIENRGEGVFIQFKTKSIQDWLEKETVKKRGESLLSGFETWSDEHHGNKRHFPGLPFIFLHSFAHMLITSVSLECGYPVSSIRERIYSIPALGYGILLFTGTTNDRCSSSATRTIRASEYSKPWPTGCENCQAWNK